MNSKIEHMRVPSDPGTITLDGACFKTYVKDLASDTSEDSARQVEGKAAEVVRNCVREYSAAYGATDVGASGSGHVSSPSKEPHTLNGLLYGRVQSGKTNSSIAAVALACANGFRCFVVLTSDNTWLGKQTADRFRDQLGKGDGPIVRPWDDWRSDPKTFADEVKEYLEDTGVVLVSTKNGKNLENLITVLKRMGAARVPGLILDDEADNASLNTKAAKMAQDKNEEPSRIFELIGRIRHVMPAHVFVQITATPQSLLLQSLDSESRPKWTVLLEPGEGYVGGDVFFKDASPYTVNVENDDLTPLRGGKVSAGKAWEIPEGFARAVCCFVTGTALRQIATEKSEVLSMLIHIAHTKISHRAVKDTLRGYLAWLDKGLRGKLSVSDGKRAEAAIRKAYDELAKTYDHLPTFDVVIEKLRSSLRNANPEIIDADNPNRKPEYHPGMNFLIGGNRLGRGVTIDGLVVTYYARDAKAKIMDTVHQHARMFGYRRHLLPITRLFSPPNVLSALRDIHESDTGTRDVILKEGVMALKPVWVGKALKPTRAGVYNPAEIRAYAPGKALYPKDIVNDKRIKPLFERLNPMLAKFTGDDEYHSVSIELLIEILKLTPSDRVPDAVWDDERIRQVLRNMEAKPIEKSTGRLNVRRGKNAGGFEITKREDQESGFAAGQQIIEARNRHSEEPILLLRLQAGSKEKGWSGFPFYAPTLILPKGKFAFLYVAS
jgi:hypothetical protein